MHSWGGMRRSAPRQARAQPEEGPVRTQVTAVGPAHEQADDQETGPQNQHVHRSRAPEEDHKGVIITDKEGGAGGGEQDRGAQVDEGQQAQSLVDPGRHTNRLESHQFLHRSEGTDRGAEGPAEKEGRQDRQHEEGHGGEGDGIRRVGRSQGHVLNGSDGADTSLAPEAEIQEREDRH